MFLNNLSNTQIWTPFKASGWNFWRRSWNIPPPPFHFFPLYWLDILLSSTTVHWKPSLPPFWVWKQCTDWASLLLIKPWPQHKECKNHCFGRKVNATCKHRITSNWSIQYLGNVLAWNREEQFSFSFLVLGTFPVLSVSCFARLVTPSPIIVSLTSLNCVQVYTFLL